MWPSRKAGFVCGRPEPPSAQPSFEDTESASPCLRSWSRYPDRVHLQGWPRALPRKCQPCSAQPEGISLFSQRTTGNLLPLQSQKLQALSGPQREPQSQLGTFDPNPAGRAARGGGGGDLGWLGIRWRMMDLSGSPPGLGWHGNGADALKKAFDFPMLRRLRTWNLQGSAANYQNLRLTMAPRRIAPPRVSAKVGAMLKAARSTSRRWRTTAKRVSTRL